jgi:hypothetical protein
VVLANHREDRKAHTLHPRAYLLIWSMHLNPFFPPIYIFFDPSNHLSLMKTRKPKRKDDRVTVSFPPELHHAIRIKAAEKGTTAGRYTHRVMAKHLKRPELAAS